MRIWETATGDCLQVLEGHTDEIFAIALSPDDQLIASTGFEHTIRLWDVGTGNCLQILENHQGWTCDIQFSPDGQRLVSGGTEQTLQIWDVVSGQRLALLESPRLYEQINGHYRHPRADRQ